MKRLGLILIACSIVSACGVKPSNVGPPEDAQATPFPRTYPDLKNEP